MRSWLIPLSICLFCTKPSFSQAIIHGKVIDKASQKSLVGVSVYFDNHIGTFTDKKGEFILQMHPSTRQRQVLTVSYVGYETMLVGAVPDSLIIIELEQHATVFPEVVVTGDGQSVVSKAIDAIAFNYPQESVVQNGLMRVYNIAGDTDYFFKGDAVVDIYFPPYIQRPKDLQVRLLQFHRLLRENPAGVFQQTTSPPKWVGGFFSIPDLVHQRPAYLNKHRMSEYSYKNMGKSVFEGRKVFIVTFSAKSMNNTQGNLFIDTATYAFMKIELTRFHVKEWGFSPILEEQTVVWYQQVNNRWYVKKTKVASVHLHKVASNNYTTDYVALAIDTNKPSSFSYRDVLQRRDENKVMPEIQGGQDNRNYDSLFRVFELSGDMRYIGVPAMDSLVHIGAKHTVFQRLARYMAGNNIRESLFLVHYPFASHLLTEKETSHSYGIGLEVEFRAAKQLFFNYQLSGNLGIAGKKTSQFGLYLLYELNTSGNSRIKVLSPLIGYSRLRIAQRSNVNTTFQYFSIGSRMAIEISHKTAAFLLPLYNFSSRKKAEQVSERPLRWSLEAGLQVKL